MNEPSSDTVGERTALIVGAGIGGLAAGIALRRAGWKTLVFERADNPRELGFALNLAPNAMAALGELGLGERLIAEGVVTDHIERFVADGIELRSGTKLPADLIVTATGLEMKVIGGIQLVVDGSPVDPSSSLTYKGMMLSDVPNLAQAGGYTNASWTLKCDLTAEYVCRLLAHMDETGMRQCTARNRDTSMRALPALTFSSGYVVRALAKLPKQGSIAPWRLYQNYALDLFALRYGQVNDQAMQFSNRRPARDDAAGPTISSLPPRRDHGEYDRPALPG